MVNIDKLKKKIEGAKLELVREEERRDQAAKNVAEVEGKIKEAGCTSESINEAIEKAQSEMDSQAGKIEKDFKTIEKAMQEGHVEDVGVSAALSDIDI